MGAGGVEQNMELALWPPGLCIRPPADDSGTQAEVADFIAGKYYQCEPDALADAILASGGSGPPGATQAVVLPVRKAGQDDTALIDGWKYWEARGWHPSHQYYVASRRWQFVDGSDHTGRVRQATLGRMLARDGPPPEPAQLDSVLPLDMPAAPGEQTVAELLAHRRTIRSYARRSVGRATLSGLLFHGLAAIRLRRQRTAPTDPVTYVKDSFGSVWDFYVCVFDVDDLEPGVYRYELPEHGLAQVRAGDFREEMVSILQGMRSPRSAAFILAFIADFPRYQWRYRHEHGLRRIYFEAGIVAQELIVLGASYGLGTLVTPAHKDSQFLDLVKLPPHRYGPVYTLTMGPIRTDSDVSSRPHDLERGDIRA